MNNNWLEVLGWSERTLEDIRLVGYSYIKEGCYQTALSFFKPLSFISSDVYDLQTLGGLYLQVGEYLPALNCLEEALKIEPGHGPTLLNRARTLLRLGYKRQAVSLSEELSSHSCASIAEAAEALLLANA